MLFVFLKSFDFYDNYMAEFSLDFTNYHEKDQTKLKFNRNLRITKLSRTLIHILVKKNFHKHKKKNKFSAKA